MELKKLAISVAVLVPAMLVQILLAVWLLPEEDAVVLILIPLILFTAFLCTAIMLPCGVLWKTRLYTHALFQYAGGFLYIALCFTPLAPWMNLTAVYTVYFLLYYVFGAIQLPLNIRLRKRGYCPAYCLFYPFLSAKKRNNLLFAGLNRKAKPFRFDTGTVRGEIAGAYLAAGRNKNFAYGNICVSVTAEPCGGWDSGAFSKLSKKLAKKAFRAVGYAVKGNALNVMILPDSARYGAGKKIILKFFSARYGDAFSFAATQFSYFDRDVLGALLPGYTDNPLIYFSEPLTDERLTAEGLRYGYFTGLAPVVRTLFSVRMPDGVSNERMDELLGQLKQRDFDGVYTLRAAAAESENPESAPPENFFLLSENIAPADGVSASACQASFALDLYRELTDARSNKPREEIERLENYLVKTLRKVRLRSEDVVYEEFGALTLEELDEAGLTALPGTNRWTAAKNTPKIEALFRLIAEWKRPPAPRAVLSARDCREFPETLKKLYNFFRDTEAICIGWEILS